MKFPLNLNSNNGNIVCEMVSTNKDQSCVFHLKMIFQMIPCYFSHQVVLIPKKYYSGRKHCIFIFPNQNLFLRTMPSILDLNKQCSVANSTGTSEGSLKQYAQKEGGDLYSLPTDWSMKFKMDAFGAFQQLS